MACDALSNPKSHLHLSFLNVVAVTLNGAVTVKIVVFSSSHVECTVNSSRRAALRSIKGEIPATAAVVTWGNPEITGRHGGNCLGISSQSHSSKRDIKNQNSFCAVWQLFVSLFSQYDNYLVWTNKVLFDSGYLVTIKWLVHLHISVLYCYRLSFSKHTLLHVSLFSLFSLFSLPVHVWSQPRRSAVAFVPSLSFLAGRTLDPRLSLCSFLSVSTTWSLGPIFPRAAQVSFSSITNWRPGGSWDTCHVCPHPGLSAITRWIRLLKIERICHLEFQSRRGSKY